MIENEHDKLVRYLTRSTREEVHLSIMAYKKSISKRSTMYEPKFRRILSEHGWTLSEYIHSLS